MPSSDRSMMRPSAVLELLVQFRSTSLDDTTVVVSPDGSVGGGSGVAEVSVEAAPS